MVFFLTEELLNSKMLQERLMANPYVQDLLSQYTGATFKFIND